MEVVAGESFACKNCSTRFELWDDLQLHMVKCFNNGQVTCKVCGKVFSERITLKIHCGLEHEYNWKKLPRWKKFNHNFNAYDTLEWTVYPTKCYNFINVHYCYSIVHIVISRHKSIDCCKKLIDHISNILRNAYGFKFRLVYFNY